MKTLYLPWIVLLYASSLLAADSKPVSYKSGDETVRAILYTPAGKGPFPAIIVIHEWWGLNDWVKEQASKLADQGYGALAIDLYRGQVATTPDMAHEIMRGVPEDRAKRDLHAAFEFLQSQPNVKKDRIGAIGWCMGGGYSLDVALQEPTLAADVINYGHLMTDSAAMKKINAPILGLFGAQDRGISPDDVHRWIPGRRRRRRVETHLGFSGRELEKVARNPYRLLSNPSQKTVSRMALISTCQKMPKWLLFRILQCSLRSTSARPSATTGCRKACRRGTSKSAPACCAAIFPA